MPVQYKRYSRPAPVFSDDGLTATLPLCSHGGIAVAYVTIDAADAVWASQWRWNRDRDGYAVRGGKNSAGRRTTFKMHRELLGLVVGDGLDADHINRDRLDNRRSNLRSLPHTSNVQNQGSRPGSASKYRGVTWSKHAKKWQAQLNVRGKMHYFGSFDSEDEAGEAALDGRRRLLRYAVD